MAILKYKWHCLKKTQIITNSSFQNSFKNIMWKTGNNWKACQNMEFVLSAADKTSTAWQLSLVRSLSPGASKWFSCIAHNDLFHYSNQHSVKQRVVKLNCWTPEQKQSLSFLAWQSCPGNSSPCWILKVQSAKTLQGFLLLVDIGNGVHRSWLFPSCFSFHFPSVQLFSQTTRTQR